MIFIEGYRNSGKTYVAKTICNSLNYKYLKIPIYTGKDINSSQIYYYMLGRDNTLLSYPVKEIVVDRSFLSNAVYAVLFNREKMEVILDNFLYQVELFLLNPENKVIFVTNIPLEVKNIEEYIDKNINLFMDERNKDNEIRQKINEIKKTEILLFYDFAFKIPKDHLIIIYNDKKTNDFLKNWRLEK